MREDVARRLTYSATPVGAQQALDWGLVTELADDPLAAALSLAGEIAGKSPSAIRAAKALITQSYGGYSDAILMAESVEQAKLIGQPDQLEVVAAAMQKRAAVFK